MINLELKRKRYIQRKRRVRARVVGVAGRPRLTVFRSARHIYAQIIDDTKGKTLVSFSDRNLKEAKGGKSEIAALVGEGLAKKALSKKIKDVVFDRGAFKFHGRIKALAEAARKGGLSF